MAESRGQSYREQRLSLCMRFYQPAESSFNDSDVLFPKNSNIWECFIINKKQVPFYKYEK